MASGNSLLSFEATDNHPPIASYATPDLRNADPGLDFDDTVAEYAIFASVLPRHYSGLGITARVCWRATTATSGSAVWTAAFERHDTTHDCDADSFASAQSGTGAANTGGSGRPTYTDIALTNAQIDGLVVGERFRLQIGRAPAHANDTMVGDAELMGVELRET